MYSNRSLSGKGSRAGSAQAINWNGMPTAKAQVTVTSQGRTFITRGNRSLRSPAVTVNMPTAVSSSIDGAAGLAYRSHNEAAPRMMAANNAATGGSSNRAMRGRNTSAKAEQ